MKQFDRKFGLDFLRELPTTPAVYLFKDESGQVLYAGKAKNIRQRLASYRNASRRKAHRKMRILVRESAALEVRLQPTEADALLVENQLIQAHRPRYNVDGAFDFLYPAIGTGTDDDRLVLCLTSEPELFEDLGLQWHGSFRPRWRARDAYQALVDLFGSLGHVEPRSRLPKAPRRKGARLVAFRRVPAQYLAPLRAFLDGESDALLTALFEDLLESKEARRRAREIGEALRFLEDFYGYDVHRLRLARKAAGHAATFVPRDERDQLFIRSRHALPPVEPGFEVEAGGAVGVEDESEVEADPPPLEATETPSVAPPDAPL